MKPHLIISMLIYASSIFSLELSGQECIQTGNNQSLWTILNGNTPGCNNPTSFNITASTAAGVIAPTTNANAVSPTGGGIITVQPINSQGSPCGNPISINVINTNFTYQAGTGCFGVRLVPDAYSNGCTYEYQIDDAWIPSNAVGGELNYNFNSGGSFNVRLRVTCGQCEEQSNVQEIEVAGVIPALFFEGDIYAETPDYREWIGLSSDNPVDSYSVVPYCISYDAGTSLIFPLQITDNSQQENGITNYRILQNGVEIYDDSDQPNDFNLTPIPSGVGYDTITYQITVSGNCIASQTYLVFNSTEIQPSFGLTPDGTGPFCIGDDVLFVAQNGFNPALATPGTEFVWEIYCSWNNSEPVYSVTWTVGSLPTVFEWSPTTGSCGCVWADGSQNIFTSRSFLRNPCSPNPPIATSQFQVLDANAEFPHDTIYCLGQEQFVWQGLNVNNCNGAHVWTVDSPSLSPVATTPSAQTTTYNSNFNEAGEWTLNHQINNTACGLDNYMATICIVSNPNGSIAWDHTDNQQVCMNNGPVVLTPVFAMAGGLNFCNQTIAYNWTVVATGTNGCITQTSCHSFAAGTQNTPNPTITLSCSGSYTIRCTVSINGIQCDNFMEERTITLVAPPQFQSTSGTCTACEGQQWTPADCYNINPCNGGPITASGYIYNSVSYGWNVPVALPNSTSVTITASTTIADGTLCTSTQNINVTVSPPPAPEINGPASVCENTPFNLSLANDCNGQWSIVDGVGITNPIGLVITAPTAYQYLCTVGGCEGGDTLLVGVMNEPDVTITPFSAIPCQGSSNTYTVHVTPSGSYTYQWSLNGVDVSTATNQIYSFIPNDGDAISVEVGYGNGCEMDSPIFPITLANADVIVDCPSIPDPLCANMSPFDIPDITFITLGLTLDSVRLNNVSIQPTAQINPAMLGIGNHKLKYFYSNNTGCHFQDSCSFSIVAPVAVSIDGDTPVCEGTSQTLIISPTGSYNAVWNSSPCPTCINTTTGVFTPNVIGDFDISLSGDCMVPTQLQIEVVPNPTGGITTPANICVTQDIPLTGTTDPANSLVTWTLNNIPITSPFNPFNEGFDDGSYELCMLIEDSNGCEEEICKNINITEASSPFPTVDCNLVFDHFCYDMPCEDMPTPNTPTDWTFLNQTWDNAPTTATQICPGVGDFDDGSHVLAFSFVDNAGCPYEESCDVLIYETTNVIITYPNDLTICESETIQFSTTPNTAPYGQWSCAQCPTCINANGLFIPQDISAPTDYEIIYDGFCVNYTFIVLRVNPDPNVAANAVSSLCINESTTLQGSLSADVSNAEWQWDGTDLSSNILDPDALGMLAGNTYEICLIGTNTYGCFDTSCFDLEIIGLPNDIVLDSDGQHCLATCFTPPVNNAVDYGVVFTHTATNQIIGPYAESELFCFPINGTYTYVITIESTEGCEITQNGQLVVLDNPVADISVGSYNVCSPEFDISNNSTGDQVSYLWSSNDLDFDVNNTHLPTPYHFDIPITPTDESYNITLTVSNVCSSSTDNITVNFVAAPVADIDIPSPLSNFNCAVFCVDLLASSASTSNVNQVIYSWPGYITADGHSADTAFTLNPLLNICFDTYVAATIIIQAEISNQCGSDIATVDLDIVPAQVSAEFNVHHLACPGTSMMIEDNSFPQGGATVTYTITPSNQGVYVENGHVIVLATAAPGSYTITQTVQGCGSDSDQDTFVVGALPAIQLASIDGVYCIGDIVSFAAYQSQPTELAWDFGDGHSEVGFNNIEHTYEVAGDYTVGVTATSPLGCQATANQTVSISGGDIFILMADSVLCSYSEFTAVPSEVASGITWTLSETTTEEIIYTTNQFYFSYDFEEELTESQLYSLQLEVEDAFGCPTNTTEYVLINPGVRLHTRVANERVFCNNEEVVVLIDYYDGEWTYNTEFSPEISANLAYPRIIAQYPIGFTEVIVSVGNDYGCSDSYPLFVETVDCAEVSVPNAFTPDNDTAENLNNGFKPIFSEAPASYHFIIYNRWGEIIFESTEYEEYWIGDYMRQNTYFVPDGVYQWYLTYTTIHNPEVKITREGHVSLLR